MKIKTRIFAWAVMILCCIGCFSAYAQQPFEGKKSEWHGCPRYDFMIENREVTVVVPQNPLPGNPWIWRPAFFDAFPNIDLKLLEEGFHITYFNTTDEWGRPEALAAGEKFYETMVNKYGLMPKVTLEGLSRGGYYSMRWGQTHPETVACLILDNPLCDLYELEGRGSWDDFQKKWGFTKENCPSRYAFSDNAIYHVDKLARNRIPILGLTGGTDPIVPYERHMRIVKQVYDRYGAPIKMIVRPNSAHHPHSLENPEPAAAFIKECVYGDVRTLKRPIKVACVGNSITAGVGTTDPSRYAYPALLQQMLGKDYDVRNFGLSCSTVLRKGTDAGQPFAYIESDTFRRAIEFQPDIVILKLGGNDSKPDNWQYKDEFAANYQELIDSFKYLNSLPEIFVCLPIRARLDDPSQIWGLSEEILRDEITPIIDSIAFQNRLTTINLHDAYEGEESICYSDNVHTTNRGAALLAQKMYDVLCKRNFRTSYADGAKVDLGVERSPLAFFDCMNTPEHQELQQLNARGSLKNSFFEAGISSTSVCRPARLTRILQRKGTHCSVQPKD